MKTLLQKLKPSIKSSIEKNKLEYNKSVESIFKKLDNTFFYSDLTISDIDLIYTFAGINLIEVSIWDFKFGDNILIKDND
jgi:hypothetical protein